MTDATFWLGAEGDIERDPLQVALDRYLKTGLYFDEFERLWRATQNRQRVHVMPYERPTLLSRFWRWVWP